MSLIDRGLSGAALVAVIVLLRALLGGRLPRRTFPVLWWVAAMRFLCTFGATTENRSEKVWPLIDEGIQCYHGDLEFHDMLGGVISFSAGKLSPTVKEELAARMKFDADNGKGQLKKLATQIEDNLAK